MHPNINFKQYVQFYQNLNQKYSITKNTNSLPNLSHNFITGYQQIFTYPTTTLLAYFQAWRHSSKPSLLNLRFYFKLTKLSLNIESKSPKYNILSLNPGFIFSKFFEKRHLKKQRQTHSLLMRFVRKVLIFLNLQHFNLIVRGIPSNLTILLKILNTPVSHLTRNPLQNYATFIDTSGAFQLKIWLVYYIKTFFFGKRKLKKKGRLKRKIARKVLANNRLID